jgi:hypothetical protein
MLMGPGRRNPHHHYPLQLLEELMRQRNCNRRRSENTNHSIQGELS